MYSSRIIAENLIGRFGFEKVFPSKKDYNFNKLLPKAVRSTNDFLDYFRGLTYGHNLVLQQKFGSVLKLYLDFTASGQPTKFVNRFLEVVEQLWANPHSSGTAAANFATHATHVAKDIIKEFYHAQDFNLFFVGAGSTGGLTHLRKILGIYLPPVTEERIQEDLSKELNPLIQYARSIVRASHEHPAERVAEAQKILEKYGNEFDFKNTDKANWPVVFITSVEHHSVEVALRGDRVILVKVPLTPDQKFDVDAFQKLVNKPEFKNRKKIALMSAASNITGLKTPVLEVSKIIKAAHTEKVVPVEHVSESEITAVQNVAGIKLVLNPKTNSYEYVFSNRLTDSDYQNLLLDERLRHRRELFVKLYRDVQAWAFFDAAAREPHEPFTEKEIEALDGFTVAAHKSEGGPGATGLLALKPGVYRADLKPTDGGAGGTVSFVSKKNHDFSHDIEERETAGTPPGLAIVRHALAVTQRLILGEETTVGRERALGQKLFDFLRDDSHFNLIGSQNFADRVPIFSFDVSSGGKPLNSKYVMTLLDLVFGIQSRAGSCFCAAPGFFQAKGIDQSQADTLREEIIERGVGAFRPGSVRLAVHYLNTPEEVQYTIDALKLIAQHGYRFLPYFKVDLATGNYEYTGPQLKIQKTKSISKNSSYSRQITFLNQLQNAELFFKKLPEPRDSEDYVSQTLNGQRHLYVGSPSAFGNIQLLQKQPRKKKSALLVANH